MYKRARQHFFSVSLRATHNRRSDKKEKGRGDGDNNTEIQNTPLFSCRQTGRQAERQACTTNTRRLLDQDKHIIQNKAESSNAAPCSFWSYIQILAVFFPHETIQVYLSGETETLRFN